MVSVKKREAALSTRASGPLSKQITTMSIGALEAALLKDFPAVDAEAWDRTGLTVGDRAQTVVGVAVALDPTVEAIREAAARGCNVLVTHHPAYLAAPDAFSPASSVALNPGAGVWQAACDGVALLSFHTALDVSAQAARVLPGMLKLSYKGVVMPLAGSRRKGYGQKCVPRPAETPFSLGQLAARCTSVFARAPRVWGDFGRELARIVTCTGSAGEVAPAALRDGADCLVCGEVKYHDALALSQAGLAIIELGHDVSELPLVAVLAAAVEAAGIAHDRVNVIDQAENWTYPETTRV